MYASIQHIITKPWLCFLQGIQYVDYTLETSSTYSVKQADAHSFIIVVQGRGVLTCSEGQTKLEPGSISLVCAGGSFSVTADVGEEEALTFYKMDMNSMSEDSCSDKIMQVQNNLEKQTVNHELCSIPDNTISVIEYTYTPWSACLECIEQLYRQEYVSDVHVQGIIRKESVAFLRISASEITLYGDECGYVGPVIYRDLGLNPHEYVRQWTQRERRVSIGLELLSQLEADHLLITFDACDSLSLGEERQLLDRTEWKQLPAVKCGNVYEVDFLTWMNYGVISHGKKIDDILRFIG